MHAPHEPRSVTVLRHVSDYLLSTSTSIDAYADDVKNVYHARVPSPKARVMHFHEGGDVSKDLRANGQLVARILNRTVKLPADLEEAMVLALPEERRHACLRDLAERYDLLPAPIPHADPSDDIAGMAAILKETGEAVQAIAHLLADGKIDKKDAPHAKKALLEISDALAALISMQARITAILPDEDQGQEQPRLRRVS